MEIQSKWRCPDCGEVHDDYGDAAECCAPSPREVFICPVCKSDFISEEIAIGCCNADLLPEDFVPEPTTAELEAEGQMWLEL